MSVSPQHVVPSIRSTAPCSNKHPQEQFIQSSGWLGLCLYNIPAGTFMILMPGIILLLMGIVLISAWTPDHISIIILVLGACMTATGFIYWTFFWTKQKLTRLKKQSPFGSSSSPSTSITIAPVQLTGIYHIHGQFESNGVYNPAFDI